MPFGPFAGMTLSAVSEAFDQHAEMEARASYLRRGRRFAALPLDQLGEVWVPAFRAAVAEPPGDAAIDFPDAEIEFRFRGETPPLELVAAEIADLEARIAADPFPRWRCMKIVEFIQAVDDMHA